MLYIALVPGLSCSTCIAYLIKRGWGSICFYCLLIKSFFKVSCKMTLHTGIWLQTLLIHVRVLQSTWRSWSLALDEQLGSRNLIPNHFADPHCFRPDTACRKSGNKKPCLLESISNWAILPFNYTLTYLFHLYMPCCLTWTSMTCDSHV